MNNPIRIHHFLGREVEPEDLTLSDRVDVHRLMLTIIPLSLWAALGVHRATRTMAACRVPAVAQVGCAALLLMGVAAGNSRFLYHQSSPPVRLSAAVLTELENIEGPVRLVFDTVHRDLGRVELPLLDRQRHSDERLPVKVSKSERDDLLREGGPPHDAIIALAKNLDRSSLTRTSHQLPATAGDALHPAGFSRIGVLDVLSSTTPRPSGRKLRWAQHLTDLATKAGEKCGLILAPAENLREVAWALHQHGAHVVERGVLAGRTSGYPTVSYRRRPFTDPTVALTDPCEF